MVRKLGSRYQLIAGERRWRAAQRAPLQRVPAVLREVRDETALEMTLVENLQREDLNPIEQAHAFQRLTDEFSFTQEQIAERTGKDRATIANSLRLLRLEAPMTRNCSKKAGFPPAGHGRALLAIAEPKERMELARRIARGGMTVRQVERLAARTTRSKAAAIPAVLDPNTRFALDELQRKFGAKAHIRPVAPGRPGQLSFEYYDAADLARLYSQLITRIKASPDKEHRMARRWFERKHHESAEWTGFHRVSWGSKLEGKLESTGTFRIDSAMKGTLISAGTLILGEHATVEGEIVGNCVIVAGHFDGKIQATGRVDIQAGRRIWRHSYSVPGNRAWRFLRRAVPHAGRSRARGRETSCNSDSFRRVRRKLKRSGASHHEERPAKHHAMR